MPQKTSAVHIVDGGYFDAAGVEAVRELAQSMLSLGGIAAGDNVQPIFLLITNDGVNPPFTPDAGGKTTPPSLPVGCRGQIAKSGCPGSSGLSSVATDLFGPLQGLYRSRGAHGERLKALLYRSPPSVGTTGVVSQVFTLDLCSVHVPMNWALSVPARQLVDGLLKRTKPQGQGCEGENYLNYERLLSVLAQ